MPERTAAKHRGTCGDGECESSMFLVDIMKHKTQDEAQQILVWHTTTTEDSPFH